MRIHKTSSSTKKMASLVHDSGEVLECACQSCERSSHVDTNNKGVLYQIKGLVQCG